MYWIAAGVGLVLAIGILVGIAGAILGSRSVPNNTVVKGRLADIVPPRFT